MARLRWRRVWWGAGGVLLVLLSLALPCDLESLQVTPRGRVHPYAHWFVQTEEKALALTFDDGPHPVYTPRRRAGLGRHGARAP
ncbi:MAG: hypothetical protein K6T75_03415, partial [Acetobacteraceae bacterium]|nr:hypothetical protein [Acetobacteraceae bacterium]